MSSNLSEAEQFVIDNDYMNVDLNENSEVLLEFAELYHKKMNNVLVTKKDKTLEVALYKYIKTKHTQEECAGFIKGFNEAYNLAYNKSIVGVCGAYAECTAKNKNGDCTNILYKCIKLIKI